MELVYSGPHDSVELGDAPGIDVKRGKPVHIPDAVAKRLLQQDTWAEARPRKADRKSGQNGDNS